MWQGCPIAGERLMYTGNPNKEFTPGNYYLIVSKGKHFFEPKGDEGYFVQSNEYQGTDEDFLEFFDERSFIRLFDRY